tara:strand:- start:630 stop:1043 length:414 start_codon:yes stop_codon:yes gene_type:complete
MFTELSLSEIEDIKGKNINDLKIILANNATEMLHGNKEAIKSEKLAKNTFKDNSSGENLPAIKVKNDILSSNIVELIAFVNKDNSKSEIRRLIKSNAIKIDNKNIDDEKYIIDKNLFSGKGFIKLSIGKKKHFKITN